MKKMIAGAAWFVLSVSASFSLRALEPPVELRAVVHAGAHDRSETPVSVEVELGENGFRAWVAAGSEKLPAQAEALGKGRYRVLWIVPELRAGVERAYTIHIAEGSKGEAVFQWKHASEGGVKTMDLLHGDRPVLRYVYTPFDPSDIERTKKPFHHVFSPDGRRLLTQGLGAKLYPHHRGIFFGYNKCKVGEETYDVWHAHRGEHQLHAEIVRALAGPVAGGHVVRIDWNDREGKPFAEETRRVVAYAIGGTESSLIELSSTLESRRGTVHLGGDLQHAGVQFRAAPWVAEHKEKTRYLRPKKWKDLPADRELSSEHNRDVPWDALRMEVGGEPYTVAYLTHPSNPEGAELSERLYGRFGEFFPWELREDNPLTVRYRWYVRRGHDVTREEIVRKYLDFAEPPRVELER